MGFRIVKTEKVKKKVKKKGRFMKGIIVGIFSFLLVFTAVILYLFYKTGNEPSTLIVSVFGACFGEFGMLTLIKKSKNDNSREDDAEC